MRADHPGPLVALLECVAWHMGGRATARPLADNDDWGLVQAEALRLGLIAPGLAGLDVTPEGFRWSADQVHRLAPLFAHPDVRRHMREAEATDAPAPAEARP